MSENDPEPQETPEPERQPEPMKVDPPSFDWIEKGGNQDDLETRDQGDTEHN
jgi:hypothetical protein